MSTEQCDVCEEFFFDIDIAFMKLVGREEFDREANLLYPKYVEACRHCKDKMRFLGYVELKYVPTTNHPSAGNHRPVNSLRLVRSQDET